MIESDLTIEVRHAQFCDYQAMATVQRNAVLHCLKELYDPAAVEMWAWSIHAEKFELLHADGEELLVCVDDDDVLGFSSYRLSSCHLGMWYVDPDYQGQGIGRALLTAAEEGLSHHHCEVAWTEASLFARPRFETLGWGVVEEYEKPLFGGLFMVAKMTKVLG